MASLPMVASGANSIKDAIYDKAFNGGFNTTYTLSDAGYSRASVNEGRVAIDTTNRRAYLYADFTATATTGSAGDWNTLKIDNFNSNYYPANNNGAATPMPLLTDDTSTTPTKRWLLRTDAVITNPKGGTPGYNSGDRFIVYGAWTY